MSSLSYRRMLLVAAGLVPAALFLYLFNPALTRLYPRCPINMLTGYYCPGCGSLRALHSLLHGNIGKALDMNPLLIASMPLLAAHGVILILNRLKLAEVKSPLESATVVYVIFFTVIAYTVARNIPVHPFTLLAPH